jgi:hypothetical protein
MLKQLTQLNSIDILDRRDSFDEQLKKLQENHVENHNQIRMIEEFRKIMGMPQPIKSDDKCFLSTCYKSVTYCSESLGLMYCSKKCADICTSINKK